MAKISKVKQLSVGSAGRVKKQLNDLYLYVSYKLHKELATLGVTAVTDSTGATLRTDGNPVASDDKCKIAKVLTNPALETVKEWEASVALWSAADLAAASLSASLVNTPKLDAAGEMGLLVLVSPLSGTLPADLTGTAQATVTIPAIRKNDLGVASVNVTVSGVAAATTDAAKVNVNGAPYTSGTATVNDTAAIAAGRLAAAIAAGDTTVTATAAGAVVTITSKASSLLPVTAGTSTGGFSVVVGAQSNAPAAFQNYIFQVQNAAGMDQALAFIDDLGLVVTDLIAIDWNNISITCANKGWSLKVMTVPSADTDFLYHAFVRQINPTIPKDFKEVADHFDGSADTIRAISIPTLTLQKVFESTPGSFKNLRSRKVTIKAEIKENNRFDSSETHFFLGVLGTPTIQFQSDNESISQLEATMYKWVTLS